MSTPHPCGAIAHYDPGPSDGCSEWAPPEPVRCGQPATHIVFWRGQPEDPQFFCDVHTREARALPEFYAIGELKPSAR